MLSPKGGGRALVSLTAIFVSSSSQLLCVPKTDRLSAPSLDPESLLHRAGFLQGSEGSW